MEYEFLIYLTGIVFFAAFIHGGVGFGFPMIATPLIALFTDLQTAIIYTLIPTLLVNIMSIRSEGNFFETIKKFYPLAILAMLGSLIGTLLIINFNTDLFKFILVAAIFLYLFFDFKNTDALDYKQSKKINAVFWSRFGNYWRSNKCDVCNFDYLCARITVFKKRDCSIF